MARQSIELQMKWNMFLQIDQAHQIEINFFNKSITNYINIL